MLKSCTNDFHTVITDRDGEAEGMDVGLCVYVGAKVGYRVIVGTGALVGRRVG